MIHKIYHSVHIHLDNNLYERVKQHVSLDAAHGRIHDDLYQQLDMKHMPKLIESDFQ